jgi:glucose-1-phosphate cytidylyltransferase
MADNPRPVRPEVAILCGGRGTRLRERTESIPKPLVEIGGRPILWHVIQIYLAQGFRRFLLLTGYRSEMIEAFARQTAWPDGVEVRCLDTGVETPTGGRVHLARQALGTGTFCLTYADGVADIDLAALLEHHARQHPVATMTVVRPQLPFGVAELNGNGLVRGFAEKPRSDQWINGGFFCLEPEVFEVLRHDSVLEREPLVELAAQERLGAFRHEGFWECLDTYKDAVALNDLWRENRAPWRVWS